MSETASANEHDAINRLFDLARDGKTSNTEFAQLESMVYDRFIQSYDGGEVATLGNAQIRACEQAA